MYYANKSSQTLCFFFIYLYVRMCAQKDLSLCSHIIKQLYAMHFRSYCNPNAIWSNLHALACASPCHFPCKPALCSLVSNPQPEQSFSNAPKLPEEVCFPHCPRTNSKLLSFTFKVLCYLAPPGNGSIHLPLLFSCILWSSRISLPESTLHAF